MELLFAGIETGEIDEESIRSDSKLQWNAVYQSLFGQFDAADNKRLGNSVCG